jgi:hypothetical protein
MQEEQDITVQAIEEETARSQGLKELQSRQQHLEEEQDASVVGGRFHDQSQNLPGLHHTSSHEASNISSRAHGYCLKMHIPCSDALLQERLPLRRALRRVLPNLIGKQNIDDLDASFGCCTMVRLRPP